MKKFTCYMICFSDGYGAANIVCSSSALKQILSLCSKMSLLVSYYPHDSIHPDNLVDSYKSFVAISRKSGSMVGFGYTGLPFMFTNLSKFCELCFFEVSSQLVDFLSKIHGVRS